MPPFTAQDALLLVPLAAIALQLIVGYAREKHWKAKIRSGENPDARLTLYNETLIVLWTVAALCVGFWLASGRALTGIGFGLPVEGWRGGVAWGLAAGSILYMVYTIVQTARSRSSRDSLRKQIADMGGVELIQPRRKAEHDRFIWLSVTAGITEEIIFRGFLIGALALVMPVWAAAVIAITAFTLGHLYQGPKGLVRVFVLSLIFTGLYLLCGSVWPLMIIHAAVDLTGAGVFRIVDAREEADRLAAEPAA